MAAKIYDITIRGYWPDVDKAKIPNHSGVYFVYEGTYDKEKKIVTLNKLIYIGESEKVRDRIADHEKYNEWEKHVRLGNTLCYSTGEVLASRRERVEAAYIFKHKPPVNIEYKDSFDFDQTTIDSSGRIVLLHTTFTVYRT
jgi:excinuclease UvrABC nuclease subunit